VLDLSRTERFELERRPGVRELPLRHLSEAEATDWRAVIDEVRIEMPEHPWCERVAFDPCVVNGLTFDDLHVGDHERGQPRIHPGEAGRIIDGLNELIR
jgi:hypothetical protein